jgi:hypothetical protein
MRVLVGKLYDRAYEKQRNCRGELSGCQFQIFFDTGNL